MKFKEQLKEARSGAGLTQKAAAELLGISIRTMQKWEIEERTPPDYVQKMVLNTLKNSGRCPHCGEKI